MIERERTPFRRELMAALPALRLLIATGPVNWSIDFACAAERGITVCGTEAVQTYTPELTLGLLLALARRIVAEDRFVRAGGWQAGVGCSLNGKTLGLVGLGRVGRMVATLAKPFGMNVVAWSQNLTDDAAASVGVRRIGKDELLATADFVSLHVVLSERTRGIIGAAELSRMKRSAFLVNTSRGPLVDEAALIAALTERRHRRRRAGRVRRRAAAAGAPVPDPRQRDRHAARRLHHGRAVPPVLRTGGREHPGLRRGQADPPARRRMSNSTEPETPAPANQRDQQ